MPCLCLQLRRAMLSTLTLPLGGCLSGLPPRPAPAAQPIFDLTQFFNGHTRGEGTPDVGFGTDRTLRVDGIGRTASDGRFRLDQTITYGDSSVETRVWLLQRVDSIRFSATLSDAKGEVQAETADASIADTKAGAVALHRRLVP